MSDWNCETKKDLAMDELMRRLSDDALLLIVRMGPQATWKQFEIEWENCNHGYSFFKNTVRRLQ